MAWFRVKNYKMSANLSGSNPTLMDKRIPLWIQGLIFGVALYLLLAVASDPVLEWNSRCIDNFYRSPPPKNQIEPNCVSRPMLSFLVALSRGLEIFIGNSYHSEARMVSSLIFGGLAAVCLHIAGRKKGLIIFIAIFMFENILLSIFISVAAH